MAERTSTQIASRRTTPQPTLEATQSSRTTRSRSRDLSEGERILSSMRDRRKKTKISPEEVDHFADKSSSRRRRARPENMLRALQDLSTVVEDASVRYPDLRDEDNGEREHQPQIGKNLQQIQVHQKSPGGVSAFSGTTARTSLTAQELLDWTSEDTMDVFEDLSRYSDQILSFVCPSGASEASAVTLMTQLQTKGSREHSRLKRLIKMFSTPQERFAGDPYIPHQKVLGPFFGEGHVADNATGQWRPDALLQKANLAVLASSMVSPGWQGTDGDFIEELDQSFPMLFATRFVFSETENREAGSSMLTELTLQLALELRTQYAIMLLARHAVQPNFDFDVILQEVFYEDSENLRGWGLMKSLSDKTEGITISRLEELRDAFKSSSDNVSTSIEFLRAKFPRISLVQQTFSWIINRLLELDNQIAANGGFGGICMAIRDKIQMMSFDKLSEKNKNVNDDGPPQIVLEYDLPSEASNAMSMVEPPDRRESAKTNLIKLGQFNANSPKDRSAAAYLKRLEATRKVALAAEQLSRRQDQPPESDVRVAAIVGSSTKSYQPQTTIRGINVYSTAGAASTKQQESEAQQEDSWRPQNIGEEDNIFVADSEDHLRDIGHRIYSVEAERQAESNKENIRIPISQAEPDPRGMRKRRLIDHQPGAERVPWTDSPEFDLSAQPSQVEEVSSDGGFQTQYQPSNPATQQRRKSTSKRPLSQPARSQGSPRKRARTEETNPTNGLEVIPDRIDTEPPHSQLLHEYRVANSAAKERKDFQPKQTQSRTQWSDEETNQLLSLIEEHGISWSLLMREDNHTGRFLQHRGQVGLKDKARNMKVDFLKSGRMLPPNFDRIPISKLQIDKLRAAGIEYDAETGQRVDALVNFEDDY